MDTVKIEFGRNLRKIRKGRRFSQEQLAYSAGIDRSYIGKIERGQVNLTIEKLYILADTLGCSPKDLIPDLTNISTRQEELGRETEWR